MIFQITDPEVAKAQGTIGVGTNKQKSIFGDIRMNVYKEPKKSKMAEALKELAMDSKDPMAMIEMPIEDLSTDLPNVAVGLDGGMSPKVKVKMSDVAIPQEDRVDLSEVVK